MGLMPAKKKETTNKQGPSFEEAMAELEETVRKLDEGDVPLEESLVAFEKGVALVRLLHGRLDAVQQKIDELTRGADGSLSTKSFEGEDDG